MLLNWRQSIGLEQSHLVEFDGHAGAPALVHPQVVSPLTALLSQAKSDGVEISIVSAYRSFKRQLTIWNDKWLGYRPVYSRHGRPLNITQMSDMERYKAISLWSALPGLSRHHWGCDFDIFASQAIAEGHQVELNPEEFKSEGVCAPLQQWLDDNLADFDFFRPYKNYQQGVSAEPWHISYRPLTQAILQQFDYAAVKNYLASSELQARAFILQQFEHYCQHYFNNLCEDSSPEKPTVGNKSEKTDLSEDKP